MNIPDESPMSRPRWDSNNTNQVVFLCVSLPSSSLPLLISRPACATDCRGLFARTCGPSVGILPSVPGKPACLLYFHDHTVGLPGNQRWFDFICVWLLGATLNVTLPLASFFFWWHAALGPEKESPSSQAGVRMSCLQPLGLGLIFPRCLSDSWQEFFPSSSRQKPQNIHLLKHIRQPRPPAGLLRQPGDNATLWKPVL